MKCACAAALVSHAAMSATTTEVAHCPQCRRGATTRSPSCVLRPAVEAGGLQRASGQAPLGKDAVVGPVADQLLQRGLQLVAQLRVRLRHRDAVGTRTDLLADDFEVVAITR